MLLPEIIAPAKMTLKAGIFLNNAPKIGTHKMTTTGLMLRIEPKGASGPNMRNMYLVGVLSSQHKNKRKLSSPTASLPLSTALQTPLPTQSSSPQPLPSTSSQPPNSILWKRRIHVTINEPHTRQKQHKSKKLPEHNILENRREIGPGRRGRLCVTGWSCATG